MPRDSTRWYAIPAGAVQAAQRAFPKGHRDMTMRDVVGPSFTNADCVDRSRHRAQEHPSVVAKT